MLSAPIHVLLIEDDENDYLLTRRLLSKAEGPPFEVAWASDYETALAALRGLMRRQTELDPPGPDRQP